MYYTYIVKQHIASELDTYGCILDSYIIMNQRLFTLISIYLFQFCRLKRGKRKEIIQNWVTS